MLLSKLRGIRSRNVNFGLFQQRLIQSEKTKPQNAKVYPELQKCQRPEAELSTSASNERLLGEIFPAAKVVPMMLTNKEPVVLPFDDVPGPKALKYLSITRQYLSEIGTQITASLLTVGLSIGSYISDRKPIRNISSLFDEYGPVVRFVSPIGNDIVLLNHPEHIQKVYALEGDNPMRSTLDCLEKYRAERKGHSYGGLYTAHGEEWFRQRAVVYSPMNNSIIQHIQGVNDVCENFTLKIYNLRNHQDEVTKDLYKELHKWAFDCMGLLVFSKKFTMLDTELVYSQCDMSWLYHSLERATEAIIKCESGLHFWKFVRTPAWMSLVKYCDSLDSLIGKHVMEEEHAITFSTKKESSSIGRTSLINTMLLSDEKMSAEDIATILMDMLLIGVNTITTSMSFLLYNLAKYQRAQKILFQEINSKCQNLKLEDISKMKESTPYLQACLKETLRLVPPIPVLTRVLSKNLTLDRYNIPRGTLIIMSTQDSALKELNYDDANKFAPERWLKDDAKEYHAFASIPFGFGARKCLGQNIAETMMSLLTIRLLQKYKLEYHYKDIHPTRSFIARPNRPLKIRFIDRI